MYGGLRVWAVFSDTLPESSRYVREEYPNGRDIARMDESCHTGTSHVTYGSDMSHVNACISSRSQYQCHI